MPRTTSSPSLPVAEGRHAAGAPLPGLRFALGLAFCAAVFLTYCAGAAVTAPLLPAARRGRIGRHGIHRGFAMVVRGLERLGVLAFDLAALDALRDEPGLILAPNHPTMLDVLPIVAALDDVCCVMKAELRRNAFLGAGARMAGYIRNDSARTMVRDAAVLLRGGGRLLIFPEATRTVGSPLNPLTGGFALIAKAAHAPVQTILIETETPYLRKGWPLLRRPPLPIRLRVRLGHRFEPMAEPAALVAAVERHLRDELANVAGYGPT